MVGLNSMFLIAQLRQMPSARVAASLYQTSRLDASDFHFVPHIE